MPCAEKEGGTGGRTRIVSTLDCDWTLGGPSRPGQTSTPLAVRSASRGHRPASLHTGPRLGLTHPGPRCVVLTMSARCVMPHGQEDRTFMRHMYSNHNGLTLARRAPL